MGQDDLGDIKQRLRAVDRDATTASFTALRQDFDAAAAGQQRIAELIQSVIDGQGR